MYVDLSDYADQTVYVVIVQNGGCSTMLVDDITLWERDPHPDENGRTSVYFEGFENSNKKLPDGWETYNKDGDIYNWKASFGVSDKIHHGKGGVYSQSYTTKALAPDNWLVMPSYKVSTTKITTLTFEAVGSHYEDYKEVFGLYISVDGGEFQQIGKDYTTSYVWKEIEVDLTPYAGKEVRVAVVHHNVTNQYTLLLDCFNIWEEPPAPIKYVDVIVDQPMIGETVPTTNAEAIKANIMEYNVSASPYMFQWKKTSKEDFQNKETPTYTVVSAGETYDADYVYQLTACFQIADCFTFHDNLAVFVNGWATFLADSIEKASYNTYDNYLNVVVPFYPLEAYIEDVAVTVTEPVVGADMDYTPTYVTTPNNTFGYDADWFKAPTEKYGGFSDLEYVSDPTEKFAEGYVYAFMISLDANNQPNYKFATNVTATINGRAAFSPIGYSPRELYACYIFDYREVNNHNLNLGSDIGVNFYLDIPEKFKTDETAEIRFTVNGRETAVPVSSGVSTVYGSKFTCNVAPAEFTDTITGQLFCNGKAEGNLFTYSVYNYIEYILDHAEEYSDVVPLVQAMNDYCTASAAFFRGLTIEGYTAPVVDKSELAAYKHTVTDNDAEINYKGQVISLNSNVTAKLYFSGKETFAVSDFTVKQGGAAVDAARLSVGSDSNGTYLAISDISADEMGKAFEISVGGVTVSNYSVYSYAREALSSGNQKLVDVVAALYKYGCAAEAYSNA